ncbi:hypothetical protein ACFXOD_36265 [Streptomyces sp. NPDC059161]|uniref:hypothetical protein n=1 Tax=Streptomyces sp. NPDC059161 TaxID=3346749 RepID=UPI00369C454C
MRLVVVGPLAVSSLALGALALPVGPAHAATPSMTCSLSDSTAIPGGFDVLVKGAKPGVEVQVKEAHGGASGAADANGEFKSGFGPRGPATATQGKTTISCGTVSQANQHDAQAQYSKGFRQGLADTKADCKKQPPQGLTAVDPNFEKGYNAGAAAGLAKFCK